MTTHTRPLTAWQKAFLRGLDAECGTHEGWRRHRRYREVPCAECNDARAAYERTKCGTYAGARIHARKHEPMCSACSEANAAYQRVQREAKPEQYQGYQKTYYDRHAEQRRAASRRYRERSAR
ncbi:hypothetical protein ACWDVX_22185 [Streptomyces tendae]